MDCYLVPRRSFELIWDVVFLCAKAPGYSHLFTGLSTDPFIITATYFMQMFAMFSLLLAKAETVSFTVAYDGLATIISYMSIIYSIHSKKKKSAHVSLLKHETFLLRRIFSTDGYGLSYLSRNSGISVVISVML